MLHSGLYSALVAVLLLSASCNRADVDKPEEKPSQPANSELNKPSASSSGDQAAAKPASRFVVVHSVSTVSEVAKAAQSDVTISVIEQFRAPKGAYSVLAAPSKQLLEQALKASSIAIDTITPVLDMNSPERGGGAPAKDSASAEHATFVIERPIPGVGNFPADKKKKISMKSNDATEQLEGDVEWVHSYLTDKGTYCVYRATAKEKIRDHAKITGAPISTIVEVEPVESP